MVLGKVRSQLVEVGFSSTVWMLQIDCRFSVFVANTFTS